MKKQAFSIQKLAYLLIVLYLLVHILIVGKSILVPLAFATVFALMLKPLCSRVENVLPYRALSILIAFGIALLPVIGILVFCYVQSVDVFQNMDAISEKVQAGVSTLFEKVNATLGLSKSEGEAWLSENSSSILQKPLSYLAATLSLSSSLMINIFLTGIYTFLLLLYRSSLKQFYLIQFGDHIKQGAEKVLARIQSIIQKYLYGLLLVMVILGVLNTAGLLVIGVDYALFWGFLAAFLAVIPYVGTFVGGLIPFLFSLATSGSYLEPIAIIVWFSLIQVIEGNLITPKVVGSSIKINPLAAILALITGGYIWGVAGLILALPFIAIIRVIFHQIDFLKPIGLLLSDELFDKEEVFEEKFDKEQFRIVNFFKKKASA